ncbi:MAG: DUF58 domain-containing protein [Chloroflexota bacterium]
MAWPFRRGGSTAAPTREPADPLLGIPPELAQRLQRLALQAAQPAAHGIGGEHRGVRRAPSLEFVDHREYHPGDDPRRIDWNVYARLDRPYVRQTESLERRPVWIALDTSGSMVVGQPSKHLVARQIALGLGLSALSHNDRLYLATQSHNDRPYLATQSHNDRPYLATQSHNDRPYLATESHNDRPADLLGPLAGRGRLPDLTAALGRLEPDGALDLRALTSTATGRGGLLIVISDLLEEKSDLSPLESARAAGLDVTVLHLLAPEDLDPSASGDLLVVDAETNESLDVPLNPTAIASYRDRITTWLATTETTCQQAGLRYLRLTTSTPLPDILLTHLRQSHLLA